MSARHDSTRKFATEHRLREMVIASLRRYLDELGPNDSPRQRSYSLVRQARPEIRPVPASTIGRHGRFQELCAAAVGTNGTLNDWNPNLNGGVNAIGVSGSTVYLGGHFTSVGDAARNFTVAVGTDGTLVSLATRGRCRTWHATRAHRCCG